MRRRARSGEVQKLAYQRRQSASEAAFEPLTLWVLINERWYKPEFSSGLPSDEERQ